MGLLAKCVRRLAGPLFVSALLVLLWLLTTPMVFADGGAPNLAYIAGTPKGVSVIDVAQQKVTGTISATGDPHYILLSGDARFLYVTQPQEGQVVFIAAKTGETFCTAKLPGQPSLLALDTSNNALFAAGPGASTVSVLDTSNCAIKRTFQAPGNVHGLAIANVASSLSGGQGNQLWVSAGNDLTVFDDVKGNVIASISILGTPQYVTIPPGATVYTTTQQGSVDAVDLNSHQIIPLIHGGEYGPMDYDATTGEIYVPDQSNNRLIVLSPVNAGFPVPKEPGRIINLAVRPESVAITSDGQLGFVALAGGNVAMLDVPGKQVIKTIFVGGNPHFIITGLYPPAVGTTPQQASTWSTVINVAAYVFVVALLVVPILLFRKYARTNRSRSDAG